MLLFCCVSEIYLICMFSGLSNLLTLGKRKSSIGPEMSTPDKRMRTDSSSNVASAPPSPWEAKRLKIDLIAAKAQVIATDLSTCTSVWPLVDWKIMILGNKSQKL